MKLTSIILLACSAALAAQVSAQSVLPQFPAYFVGEDIQVSFAGGPGNPKDWVGIYPDGVVPGAQPSTRWNYVNNTQTSSTGSKEGLVTFPTGLQESGTWTSFLLKDDGYDVLAQSNLAVLEEGAPLVRANRSYTPNSAIEVQFFNGPGNGADWVGIFKDGLVPATGVSIGAWNYVGGTQSVGAPLTTGKIAFPSGLAAGKWVVYFLENNGYKVLSSQAITVADAVQAGSRLLSSSPADKAVNVPPSLDFSATIINGASKVDLSTIVVQRDGQTVPHTAEQKPDTVVITAPGQGLPEPNSTHAVKLSYKDESGASFSHDIGFTIMNFRNVVLPAPLYFENFDSVPEGKLPAGWTERNYGDKSNEEINLGSLGSASYASWLVVNSERFKSKMATYDNDLDGTPDGEGNDYQRVLTPNPTNVLNGQILSGPLASGRILFSTSGYRAGGSQVMYVFTPDYDLSGKTGVTVAFKSLWEQNQDSIAALEFSIDKGATWLPVAYFLDTPDVITKEEGGKTVVDVEATLTTEAGDIAVYTDEKGDSKGSSYGAFIAAPITQALAPFIQGRLNDNASESKRVESYRLPQADNQKTVRFRFAHAGTDSWYWGIDDFGIYSDSGGDAVAPSLSIARETRDIVLTWPAALAGYTLESSENMAGGSWTPVANATGGQLKITPTAPKAFYRWRKN